MRKEEDGVSWQFDLIRAQSRGERCFLRTPCQSLRATKDAGTASEAPQIALLARAFCYLPLPA